MTKGRCDRTTILIICILFFSFLLQARRTNNNSIYQNKNIRGQRKPSEDEPPTSWYSLFIDAEAEQLQNKNFHCISRDGLNPKFFGMLDQPNLIQSCHMISSIMKLRFGSLICQLFSLIFKEGRECIGILTKAFWIASDASTFRAKAYSLRSTVSPRSLEKEEAEGELIVVKF